MVGVADRLGRIQARVTTAAQSPPRAVITPIGIQGLEGRMGLSWCTITQLGSTVPLATTRFCIRERITMGMDTTFTMACTATMSTQTNRPVQLKPAQAWLCLSFVLSYSAAVPSVCAR